MINRELAKAISTSAIWISVAVILAFGLFRMNGDDGFFIVATAIIMGCAFLATFVIWHLGTPSEEESTRRQARGFEVVQPAQQLGQ
jgi:hypothetical protein